jgi:HEAT repeat protein
MNMQFDRYREVAGINRHTEHPGPLATGREELDELISQLRREDGDLRISAAHRASIFRHPAAEPALLECLKDPRREVRVAATMALAACGTRGSIAPLFAALEDGSPLVAQAAAIALENLTGCPLQFNAFVDAGERERQAVEWKRWLAGNSWARLERSLVDRLNSGDRDAARRAAVALGHIGSSDSHQALRTYLVENREDNPLPAWRAAGNRGDRARFNSLAPVNPRTLQAVARSIGCLDDQQAVPLLAETLAMHSDPATGNLFLAEAAAEALGRIGTPEAQQALVTAFASLQDYPVFTSWYGDHSALMACHASPVHYFIIEALDALGSHQAASILPHMIRSVPIDPDRALLLQTDDYEGLVGRVIRRHDCEAPVVETCLALLGDPQAQATEEFEDAIRTVHRCWGGHPGAENRAAQILSLVCRDGQYEPRIRAAFERYRALPVEIPRVFDTGIPVVLELPLKNWVCFYLARTLGNLADPRSAEALNLVLRDSPSEAAGGRPDPLGPGCLFLHNDLTPCWRAAVAWALGRIGDRQAVPTLLGIVKDLDNAPDTRHAAAEALHRIGDPDALDAMRDLAASYPEISTRKTLFRAMATPTNGPQGSIAGKSENP